MNTEYFSTDKFIQSIANNTRWTVSTNTKMPINMRHLIDCNEVKGAKFENDKSPLVKLQEIIDYLPNVTNFAYFLNQSTDHFVVLDIEPKCPAEIRDKLLRLPCKYIELSMSGKGFHLVFDTPDSVYKDIIDAKPAIKEEHGYYEILLNHYVTFTGNICKLNEGIVQDDISEFYKIFDTLASQAEIKQSRDIDTADMPELESIPLYEDILNVLIQAQYKKTLADVNYDNSKYEFGVIGFYFNRMNMLLNTTKYKVHDYSEQERIVLLYHIVEQIIPYREKHDTYRDGLPLLMYDCKKVISTNEKK